MNKNHLPRCPHGVMLCLCLAFIFHFSMAQAASVMSVGQDEGYSGRVLDRIIRKWSPPQQLKRELRLTVLVSVDGSGELLECKVRKPSGLDALDVSACAAVRAAAPYGAPPYGMPAELYFSFWSGNPEARAPADPALPGLDTSAAEAATARAHAANESAKLRAGEAARKSGKHIEIDKTATQANGMAPKKALVTPKTHAATPEKPHAEQATLPATAQLPAQPSNAARVDAAAPPADKMQPPLAQDKYAPQYAKYLSSVTWKLRNAMYVPVQTPKGMYFATVRIKCDKAGKIISSEFLEKSGDEYLDRYIMQGLKRAGHITPPPAGIGDTLDLTFSFLRK